VGATQLTEQLALEYLVERFADSDAEVPVTFTELTKKTLGKLVESIQESLIEQALSKSNLLKSAKVGALPQEVVNSQKSAQLSPSNRNKTGGPSEILMADRA